MSTEKNKIIYFPLVEPPKPDFSSVASGILCRLTGQHWIEEFGSGDENIFPGDTEPRYQFGGVFHSGAQMLEFAHLSMYTPDNNNPDCLFPSWTVARNIDDQHHLRLTMTITPDYECIPHSWGRRLTGSEFDDTLCRLQLPPYTELQYIVHADPRKMAKVIIDSFSKHPLGEK